MLENRKINPQPKTIRRPHEDNIRLAAENKELKEKYQEAGLITFCLPHKIIIPKP